jgi:hypothetical protein
MTRPIFIATLQVDDTRSILSAFVSRDKAADALVDHIVEFFSDDTTIDEAEQARLRGGLKLGYPTSVNCVELDIEEVNLYE